MLVVPNAPCGVESQEKLPQIVKLRDVFLMHRVELKENKLYVAVAEDILKFLMHRVELKGPAKATTSPPATTCS